MLLSEFSLAEKEPKSQEKTCNDCEKISACPRTIICNNCEQNNTIGEILNADDSVDDKEYFGFTGSYFNISPTVIDDYTKK